MDKRFKRTFKIVLGVHVIFLGVLCCSSVIAHLLTPRPEVVVPIEFVVDVTPPMPDVDEVLPDIPPPEPEPVAEPDPIPEPVPAPVNVPEKPKPKPKPKRRKPKIQISHKRVTRTVGGQHRNRLSQAEIQKLLDSGAKPSDHVKIPGEDARCMAVIKNTLYAAWNQPNSSVVGNAVCVLRIDLSSGGRVSNAQIVRRSGNTTLDRSVEQSASGIRRVHGLTESFIRRHPSVTVSFTVAP